jgi:uncharacterized protein YkwD
MGIVVTTAQAPIDRDMLAAHNALRAKAGVPALTWSKELESAAKQWAAILLSSGDFRHSPGSRYGQNLFETRGRTASPARVVENWSQEAENYDARSNTCRGVCGHYTQLVWRDTRQVGCAVAGGNRREIWVCNYNPPGNVMGQRPF